VSTGASTTHVATYRHTSAPPTANAGPDFSVNSNTGFTLAGTASSDPEGGPLEYAWTQVAGQPVVIQERDQERTFVNGVRGPATLTFQLTVTDVSGQTHTDTIVVTVKAPK
jgi:hypothetical protein